eukprot:8443614-Alexandrium_andersonii.AAC.1
MAWIIKRSTWRMRPVAILMAHLRSRWKKRRVLAQVPQHPDDGEEGGLDDPLQDPVEEEPRVLAQ